jgi:hypothetical protein
LKILNEQDILTVNEIVDCSNIRRFIVERILAKMITVGVVDFFLDEHDAFYSLKHKLEPFE